MSKKDLPQINPAYTHLMPGDILLFPPNSIADGGWVGQAIVYFTKGEVSHSAVYCGEMDGIPMIAHAEPNGINYQSFESLLAGEPCCYIRRRTGELDLTPVLDAVKSYTGNGNSYPFVNLGIIGLLILLNKFSDDSPLNRIVYDFALLVGVKIMKQVQERVHEGETPMMCSQLAWIIMLRDNSCKYIEFVRQCEKQILRNNFVLRLFTLYLQRIFELFESMENEVYLRTLPITYPLPAFMRKSFNNIAVNQLPQDCDKYNKKNAFIIYCI